MASLRYFLLGLFVFLCLSCSSANRVLLDSHVGDQDLPLNKPMDGDHAPVIETGFGFGAGSGVGVGHGAGESSPGRGIGIGSGNGYGVGVGVGSGVGGSGYGIGVGFGSGHGPGFGGWTGPGFGGGPGPGNGCVLGYVCPSIGRGGCSNLPYGSCQAYNFFPLTPMDLHEIEINWAENKHVEMKVQHDEYEAAGGRMPPPILDSHQSTGAQNGV